MTNDEKLDKLFAMVSEIHAEMMARNAARAAAPAAPAPTDIVAAPDSVLDNDRGDPKLRKSPAQWEGRDLAGLRYSELEIPELEAVVDFLKWKLDNPRKDDDPKYIEWNKLDCARALGWIRRQKAGRRRPGSEPAADDSTPPF